MVHKLIQAKQCVDQGIMRRYGHEDPVRNVEPIFPTGLALEMWANI